MLLDTYNPHKRHKARERIFSDKADLLDYCYPHIENIFNELSTYAPDISALMRESSQFSYVKGHNKKTHMKVGYKISWRMVDDMPAFLLFINSFKHGGEKYLIKSFDLIKPLLEQGRSHKGMVRTKPSIISQSSAQKSPDTLTDDYRASVFKKLCDRYDKASIDLSHPYLNQKAITHAKHLRVCGADILIPLFQAKASSSRDQSYQVEFERVGFQVIDTQGRKKTHIKAAGLLRSAFMIVNGSLDCAHHVYLSEGYATGDKVPFLAKSSRACVISCVSANNILPVISQLKKVYVRKGRDKVFHIVADNDVKSAVNGKGNAGLRFGFDALRIAGKGSSIIIPPCLEHQSDWDDLYRLDRDSARLAFKKETFKTYQAYLAHLSHYPRAKKPTSSLQRAIYASAKEMMALVPALFSVDQVADQIFKACEGSGASATGISIICNKLYKKHAHTANVSRVLTDQYVDHFIEVDNIDCANRAIEKLQQDQSLVDNNLVFLIDAPMGSGKTQKILKPQFKRADNEGDLPVCTHPTCSLTRAGASLLGASHYDDDKSHDFNLSSIGSKSIAATSLAVTCNSLGSERFNTLLTYSNSFFVDEVSQVYRAIVSGTVDDNKRVATERLMAKKINESRYTFLADADMNDLIAKYIHDIKEPQVITVAISVTQKPFIDTTYQYIATTDTSYNHAFVMDKLLNDVISGERIYCALDSCKKANIIYEALLEHIDPEDILLITRDSVASDKVRAFLDNPNDFIKKHKPRIIVATPAIQSGISIEIDYFTLGYGFYTGTVTPNDFRQMLHRVRTLKCFKLALSSPIVRHDPYNENAEYILLKALEREVKYANLSNKVNQSGNVGIDQYDVVFKDGSKHYEFLAADLMASNAKDRHNATNYFLIQAHTLGVNIQVFDDAYSDKKILKDKVKNLKESVNKKDILSVVGINTLTQSQRDNLSLLNRPSALEKAQMRRFDIAKLIGRDIVTEEDITFINDHPSAKLRNYLLCEDFMLAQAFDGIERKNAIALVQRSNKETMVLLYYYMSSLLNIDPTTLEGTYGERQAQSLKEAILDSDELSAFVRLKLNIPLTQTYQPRRLANNLFKRLFGLKAYAKSRSRSESRKQTYALDEQETTLFIALAKRQQVLDQINHNTSETKEAA